MTKLKTVPGSEIYFSMIRNRVAMTSNIPNQVGLNYKNLPNKKRSFEQWSKNVRLLPKQPGILVVFQVNRDGSFRFLKILKDQNNLQKAFYSITNLQYFEEIWGLLEKGTHLVMVQLAKAS